MRAGPATATQCSASPMWLAATSEAWGTAATARAFFVPATVNSSTDCSPGANHTGTGVGHEPCGSTVRNPRRGPSRDRKSTRLNSSHSQISYAVFCLKKKKNKINKYQSQINTYY